MLRLALSNGGLEGVFRVPDVGHEAEFLVVRLSVEFTLADLTGRVRVAVYRDGVRWSESAVPVAGAVGRAVVVIHSPSGGGVSFDTPYVYRCTPGLVSHLSSGDQVRVTVVGGDAVGVRMALEMLPY